MKIKIEMTADEMYQSIKFARKIAPEMGDKVEETARESMNHCYEAHSNVFDAVTTPLTDDGLTYEINFKSAFVVKMMRRFEPIIAAAKALGEIIIGYFADIEDDIGDVKTLIDGKDPVEELERELDELTKSFNSDTDTTDAKEASSSTDSE